MERTVLVTGAAGFIGSHLVDRLLAGGRSVIGIDSFEDYYPRYFKEANLAAASRSPGFRLVEANLLDLAAADAESRFGCTLAELVSQAECVFHLAAQAGVRSSWGSSFATYTNHNILATQLVLEAARSGGARVVYASSSSVYGDTDQLPMNERARCRPLSPYGVSKLAGEHLCDLYTVNFAVPTATVRFFTAYGARQRPDMAFHRFLRAALTGEPIKVFGDGRQTRDFTHVSDIVSGIVLAADPAASGVYNLGGGSRVSLLQAIDVIGQVCGRDLQVESGATEAGDVKDTWADLTRAKSELGYAPQVGLRQGLDEEREWLTLLLAGGLAPEQPSSCP